MMEEPVEPKQLYRLSRQHLELLVQYMERYPRLALATARNRDAHVESRHIWEKIARTLNKLDENVIKTGRGWSRYWVTRKFRARRKHSIIRKCQSEGAECPVEMDSYETRIINIITDKDGNLLPVNEFTDEMMKLQESGGCSPEFDIQSLAEKPDATDSLNHDTEEHEMVGSLSVEVDIKPTIQEDPIRIEDTRSLLELDKERESHTDHKTSKTEDKRTLDELRRDMLQFELLRRKELFVIEKTQLKERHRLDMELLELKKQLLIRELNK